MLPSNEYLSIGILIIVKLAKDLKFDVFQYIIM